VIPVSWFVALVAGWVMLRLLLKLEQVLVARRSRGFRALVAVGGMAFGLPALAAGQMLAGPVVALAAYSAWGLGDLRHAVGQVATCRVRRRPVPDNVVPLRPS
jgi:hypothetical protein